MWNAYRADYGPVWTPESMPYNPDNTNLPLFDRPETTGLKIHNNIIKGSGAMATVKLFLAEAGNASVKIFDSKGREIITLWDGYKEAGEYNLPWDVASAGGKKIGSGVYMVHLQAGGYKQTRKIVVVK